MQVWGGRLYATGCNAVTGTEVWEYDGIDWTQVNIDGFNKDVNNTMAPCMAAFNGNLYVGTKNVSTGCEIWEYDGYNWTQVNSDGFGSGSGVAFSMGVFRNKLYVGTANPSGGQVWEYDGSDWTLVNTPGFGDANNLVASSLSALSENLYAGTKNFATGSEVWRFTTLPTLKGDLNGDGDVDLTDAILALQVLAGLNPDGIHLSADVDGDGRIGLAEIIYILQNIAELR